MGIDKLNRIITNLNDSTYNWNILREYLETVGGSLGGSGVGGAYVATIGNGASTSFPITHSLGTDYPDVVVIRNSDDVVALVETVVTDLNTVTLNFVNAPASNAFRVIVRG